MYNESQINHTIVPIIQSCAATGYVKTVIIGHPYIVDSNYSVWKKLVYVNQWTWKHYLPSSSDSSQKKKLSILNLLYSLFPFVHWLSRSTIFHCKQSPWQHKQNLLSDIQSRPTKLSKIEHALFWLTKLGDFVGRQNWAIFARHTTDFCRSSDIPFS